MRNSLIDTHQAALKDLCKKYHVRRLEVFGSAVRDDYDPQCSDVDLLVEIEPPATGNYFDDYFNLREGLESLLNCPVDLVSIDALDNPYFIERIASERETLYAA